MKVTLNEAWDRLEKEIKDDPEYAWAVHCNLTMPIYDTGVCHSKANEAAARIMQLFFKIDIRKHENFKRNELCKEDTP